MMIKNGNGEQQVLHIWGYYLRLEIEHDEQIHLLWSNFLEE
jgi:hypothetical protein